MNSEDVNNGPQGAEHPGDAGPLTGRVAVVTGAGGGIGAATVHRLALDGARVLAVDVDDGAVRRTVAGTLVLGGTATSHVADLADPDGSEGVVPAALERFGRVDILVNNAAYHGPRVPFLDLPPAEWDRTLNTNLSAAARLCQDAARDMAVRGFGAIVNITAIQEHLPVVTYAAYGASKGGVSALTRALAAELSPLGIRVNAIAPGMIGTPNLQRARSDDAPPAAARTGSPTLLGRDGLPEELAAAVAFLASDEASFITGAVLPVDGGRSLSRRWDPIAAQHDLGGVHG